MQANSFSPKASMLLRIVSAVAAILVVALLFHFLGSKGLQLLVFATVVIGTRELIGILFFPGDSLFLKTLFYLFMVSLFSISVIKPEHSSNAFAVVAVLFFSSSLLYRKRFQDLERWYLFQGKSILGFLYLGILPAFACRLLDLDHGQIWFLGFLATILAGDTGAYFVGLLFGHTKIMPEVSPKKTRAGVWGGVFGSFLASTVLHLFYLPDVPMAAVLVLGVVSGLVGQMGDLFESALKRVANVKDSGSIMPGHGGILDRIDGLLFAAPFYFAGALILEKFY